MKTFALALQRQEANGIAIDQRGNRQKAIENNKNKI